MRLTLRTLLAYMDGVLESEDAEEIARKIEESDYATEIVHRTRDVVRRLRLGAPPLEPRGQGLDANSVAEYLDNTLTSERVADFEALCLDTDIHLAEVAGCHQILTYVLGAPAEIDPQCRQRMYDLMSSGDQVGGKPGAVTAARSAADTNGASTRPEPKTEQVVTRREELDETPDYPQYPPPAPKTGRVIAAMLVLLVTGAILIGMQPSWLPDFLKFENPQIAQQDPGSNDQANASGTDANSNAPPAGQLKQPEGAGDLGNQDPAQDPTAGNSGDQAANSIPAIPPLPEKNNAVADTNADTQGPANNQAGDVAADNATGGGDAESIANNAADANESGAVVTNDGSSDEANVADPNLPPDSAPTQLPARVVGQLISTDSVMLRFGGSPPSLSRQPQLGNVMTGEPLISLPDYRNAINIGGEGISLQAVGEVHLEFEAAGSEDELPRINLKQGRILLNTVGAVGKRLRLRTGDLEYAMTFLEPGSALAISARRVRAEDAVPNTQPAATELVVDSIAGKTVWESFARGGRWELSAGQRWAQSALPSDPIVADASTPDWATTMSLPPLAAKAAAQIEQYLRGELAVRVRQALLEQVMSNRIEVSSLANRCLTAADDFESSIDSLNDDRYRAFWDSQLESLHRAVVRSPQSAELVKIALESSRGSKGAELYRMLWGYTAKELREGGHAAKLVEYLKHDDLDFRVLAVWNLENITGITNVNYRPETSANLRQRAARQWELKLENGEIVPQAGN